MSGYEQKVQESRSCSVHKAGCLNWSSVDPGTLKKQAPRPAKEGKNKQAKSKSFLYKLLADSVAHIKGVFFSLKIQIKDCVFLPQRSGPDVGSHTSNQAKNVSQCALLFWIIVHYGCSHLDNQEQPSELQLT